MPGATDFFVSYNHNDLAWAEWIAWQLEDAGYSSLIQAWDFRPGSNFVVEMQNGLSSANRMIIVLSGFFLKSDFTAPEWAAVFAQDPRGIHRNLVPVRVSECKPTGLLTSMVYVDLVGKEEAVAREELLSGVREGRAKPAHAPRFPRTDAPAFPKARMAAVERQAAERARFTLVLTGTIDSLDRPLVEAILEHLKKVSSDASMTLIRAEDGSIRLTLECSPDGLERLKDLFQSGQLFDVARFPIEAMFEEAEALSTTGNTSQILPSVEAMFERRYRDFVGVAKGLLQRLGNPEDLDEAALVNEAFVRLWRPQKGPGYPGIARGGLKAVIARTMRGVLLDSFHRAAYRGGQPQITFEEPLTDSDRPLTLLMVDEALARLAQVDERGAEILELYYFGGLSLQQVSEVMGMAISNVHNQRRKALQLLRDILTKLPHENLSDREYDIMLRIASGQTVGEIAATLNLSAKTVSTYRTRILQKMGKQNNSELIQYAIRSKLVE